MVSCEPSFVEGLENQVQVRQVFIPGVKNQDIINISHSAVLNFLKGFVYHLLEGGGFPVEPYGIFLHWYSPEGTTKAVFSQASGARGICQYLSVKSVVNKNWAPHQMYYCVYTGHGLCIKD